MVTSQSFHPETRRFFSGRRVVITGGSGFIGSHAVEQLLMLDAHPIVISRQQAPPFLKNVLRQIEIRHADLDNLEQTRQAFSGASVVLNMAADVAGLEYNMKHPASIFQNNLQIFFNSIKVAQELKVDRFLVTSSACVYPRHCSLPTPESEGMKDEPEPTNSGYGWAKRMEEFLGAKYAQEFGLSVAIARPYNAYGPRDNFARNKAHIIPALIRKAYETETSEFEVWGDGSHSRSFLFAEDFARGCLEVAARYDCADPINVGAQEESQIGDVARSIAAYMSQVRGREIRPRFNPQGITGQPRRLCDTEKLREKLGFQAQVTLQEGLKHTIDWYVKDENRTLYPN